MYCIKCGAQLPPNSQFCTHCGAKVETDSPPNMGPDAPPNAGPDAPPNAGPDAPPNMGPDAPPNMGPDAPPNVGPITPSNTGMAPPPMDEPYGFEPPKKKKSKALLWTLIGVGAALIVAAVLFFVVFAPGGGSGPFSGNTVQTRFANDAVGVFTGAFGGYNDDSQAKQLLEKPFDMSMNMSTVVSGIKSDVDLSAAYDEQALGLSMTSSSDYSNSDFAEFFSDDDSTASTIKLLLMENILYNDQDDMVSGLKFDTDADLSKPMSLKERIAALLSSGEQSDIDYLKLAEMLLNSIDEKCFDKSTGETTLTLDADSLEDTLKVFSDKLEDDKELNDALSSIIEELSGYEYDASDIISLAAPMISQLDFELVWTVDYENGTPVGNTITFEESGSTVFEAVFEYDETDDIRDINIELTASGQTGTVALQLAKTANGVEYKGTVSIPGSDEITLSGLEETSGSDISGSLELSSAGSQIATVTYEGTISIGMPEDAVEDDSRFEMDTNGASITDFSLGSSGSLSEDLTDLPLDNMLN